jgi:hypothetical protein
MSVLKDLAMNRSQGPGAGQGMLLGISIGAAFILGLGISRALKSGQSSTGSSQSQGF